MALYWLALTALNAAGRLESSALRLKVVDAAATVLESKTQIVASFCPNEVGIKDVLVVAEEKWVPGIGISHVGEAGDLESRDAAFEEQGAIGAGDVKGIETECAEG